LTSSNRLRATISAVSDAGPIIAIRCGPRGFAGCARRLSYQEAARLQGLPRNMKFPDTYGLRMRYRVIGNSLGCRLQPFHRV